jgi:hypothetical protein
VSICEDTRRRQPHQERGELKASCCTCSWHPKLALVDETDIPEDVAEQGLSRADVESATPYRLLQFPTPPRCAVVLEFPQFALSSWREAGLVSVRDPLSAPPISKRAKSRIRSGAFEIVRFDRDSEKLFTDFQLPVVELQADQTGWLGVLINASELRLYVTARLGVTESVDFMKRLAAAGAAGRCLGAILPFAVE